MKKVVCLFMMVLLLGSASPSYLKADELQVLVGVGGESEAEVLKSLNANFGSSNQTYREYLVKAAEQNAGKLVKLNNVELKGLIRMSGSQDVAFYRAETNGYKDGFIFWCVDRKFIYSTGPEDAEYLQTFLSLDNMGKKKFLKDLFKLISKIDIEITE